MKLSLQQLSERAGVPGRSIRFYIQKGLLAGPEGEKRGAYYTEAHLADLLRIRYWQESGLSLDAIAGLLMARSEPPVATLRPGAMEVRTHLVIADGLELMVAPERARLTQAQLRVLFRHVQDAYAELREAASHVDPENSGDMPHEPID
ncbi:MAG TPA: MerR family transcriptional regulator [Chiayiivirga sp.]|nr:MerR family transcriptional regulator [Chiayiivirga sp.]